MFVHVAGDFAELTLAPDDALRADAHSLVWFDETVDYRVAWTGGLRRAVWGGEGFFLSTFKGPGRVVLQSMGHAPTTGKH